MTVGGVMLFSSTDFEGKKTSPARKLFMFSGLQSLIQSIDNMDYTMSSRIAIIQSHNAQRITPNAGHPDAGRPNAGRPGREGRRAHSAGRQEAGRSGTEAGRRQAEEVAEWQRNNLFHTEIVL